MRKRPPSSSSPTSQSPDGVARTAAPRGPAPARPAPQRPGSRADGKPGPRPGGKPAKPAPYAAVRPAAVEREPSRSRPAATPRPAIPRSAEPRSADANSSGGAPWLWGHHAVAAALKNPQRKLVRLVATEDAAAELAGMLGEAAIVEPQVMNRDSIAKLLPPGAVHQGVALLAKTLKPWQLEDVIAHLGEAERAIVVVLDQVTDPHNIGAVLRSAAAFGAVAVVLPDRNAPEISGTLAKSASGAVEHVPLVRVVNLNRALEQLKKAGFWSVGLAGDAEATLASHKLSGRVCLVLGSEGDGLRRLTREACDLMARLPTQGPVASLNVSNAAAIALYELVRAG
ncbi:MAG TPA: 23S rRNA (guanosine(2251)-2'-O)-methyltransferase RlmB [Aliidongia sp.]|uniref:23S rRNA (guanosine(2251)-2'-O)-methyltransferase RlmB n=1 Tax=Aliidongia sp. TaxID=1914230 RepID=UPI002DDD51BD|nr:23S rRNA (guanosine(2251)-2'-O)-methyltransferase RlmB [Aliidongia sp.]HEV2674998.1 23S rRNA (guanosine(2251)-2'-O)-methyltransferase RlmB [Aliidongia sp.]